MIPPDCRSGVKTAKNGRRQRPISGDRPSETAPGLEALSAAFVGAAALGGLRYTFSSFCRQRVTPTSGGIGVSGKLVFQSVTPTSPR